MEEINPFDHATLADTFIMPRCNHTYGVRAGLPLRCAKQQGHPGDHEVVVRAYWGQNGFAVSETGTP